MTAGAISADICIDKIAEYKEDPGAGLMRMIDCARRVRDSFICRPRPDAGQAGSCAPRRSGRSRLVTDPARRI